MKSLPSSLSTRLKALWKPLSEYVEQDSVRKMGDSLADLAKPRQLIYTGPCNAFIQRLKIASVGSTVATVVGSPVLLHYLGSSSWSFGTNLFILTALTGTSMAQALIADRLLNRYVLHAYRLIPDKAVPEPAEIEEESPQDDRLEFVTMDLLGRPKRQIFSACQLEPAMDPVGSLSVIGGPHRSFVMLLGPSKPSEYLTVLCTKIPSE